MKEKGLGARLRKAFRVPLIEPCIRSRHRFGGLS
jgi:hypothetical protein